MITHNGLVRLGFKPEIDFVLRDESDGNGVYMYEWNSSSPQPTVAEIESANAEWQAEHDSQEYARNRQAEYPSIQECIHAILDDQLDALQAKRQSVKTKYPKG